MMTSQRKEDKQKKQITARTVKAKDNVWEPSASFAVSSTTSTNAAHKGNEKQQQKREITNALTMAHTLAYPHRLGGSSGYSFYKEKEETSKSSSQERVKSCQRLHFANHLHITY